MTEATKHRITDNEWVGGRDQIINLGQGDHEENEWNRNFKMEELKYD